MQVSDYQVMPPLSENEYESLKAQIARDGVLVPVEYDEAGNMLDGFHRVKACRELSIENWPSITRLGLTEIEKRTHARTINAIRRHLNREQKRELVRAQLLDTPEWSNNRIAQLVGVTHPTVIDIRQEMIANGELVNFTSLTGADGKQRPAEMPEAEPSPQARMEGIFTAGVQATSDVQQIIETAQGESKIAEKAEEEIEKLQKAETTVNEAKKAIEKAKAGQATGVTTFSSESNEYYTPSQYIEAAREVMGSIDLDPASHPVAQETIEAGAYFTENEDGRLQEWHGRVWLNPPYGKIGNKSSQGIWAQYLKAEYEAGRVIEAVLLVKAAVGYEWFEKLWDEWPVCFARERLSFIRSDGDAKGQSKQGTAFFYLGDDAGRFIEVFSQFGRVIMPDG